MRNRGRRLGIVLVGCALAAAGAGQALAALTPGLSATTSAAGSVVTYSQATSDDPLGALTFYAPSGFTALLAQPEGETLGTARATAVAADSGNAGLSLTGTIKAAAATTSVSFGGETRTVGDLSTPCTGTPVHGAYWIVSLSQGSQTLQLPVFVDDVPLTSPLSDVANNTIRVCFAPPNVPAGTPGRSPSGTRVTSLTLVPNVFSVPPGWYEWHVVAAPFTAGGVVNPAAAVEAQSVDRTPQQVTLRAKAVKGKKRQVAVTGRVLAGDKGVSGAGVSVLVGSRVVGRTTSKAGGAYTLRLTLPAASATLVARAAAPAKSAGSCTPAFPPATCSGKTWGAFEASSAKVRVRA